MSGTASSTSSIRFHEAMPRWRMLVTQPNAIIGQLSITRYELKATNSPSVSSPANHVAAPEPEDQQRPEAEKERHARIEQALQADQDAVAAHEFEVRGAEPLDLVRLLVVGAHHAHARQRLLDDGAEVGELFLDRLEALVDGRAEVADADRDERQRQQRHQRQPGVEREHQHDRDDEHQDGVGGVHHRRADHHAHGVEIVGRARHQVAGPPRLVVGERHLLQPREERVADVVLDVARGADEDVPHQVAEHRADAGDAEQHARVEGELAPGHAGGQIIDGELEDPRREQLDRGGDDDADEAQDELAAVFQEKREQPAERGTHLF